MKRIHLYRGWIALCVAFAFLVGSGTAVAESWKFGVMADTQWTAPSDPMNANPNGVAVSIINQLNQQFIKHGVKFVIQVGDLTENGNDLDIATRAAAAQALYDKGIGFFPMRGNHETYANPSNQYGIPAFQTNFPQTRGLVPAFKATNFSSPALVGSYPDDLLGMSYSFDFGAAGSKARFVIIDDWATANKRADAAGYAYGYSVADQQSWISDRLNKATRGTEHAFVFSHQNLIGQNHQDSLFSGYTNANPDMQNAFFASLMKNGVGYYISGHDHIHQRSLIISPDGISRVRELICASNSSKFYTPKDLTDANWFGQKRAETSLSQDRYTVGFYIFTVDGPRVTVEYYADATGNYSSDNCFPDGTTPQKCSTAGSHATPTFNFVNKETWGYSINGQEFFVPQGMPYTAVIDSFQSTTARILGGTNNSTSKDYTNRPFTKEVNTGWTDVNTWANSWLSLWHKKNSFYPTSDIFTIWGMADVGTTGQTDTYALSMTFDGVSAALYRNSFGIAAQDDNGNWVNAVDLNIGQSSKKYVWGPWKAQYGLGTYGFDPGTNTVWAVINYNSDFAVGRFEK